jgi:hypothetical protein
MKGKKSRKSSDRRHKRYFLDLVHLLCELIGTLLAVIDKVQTQTNLNYRMKALTLVKSLFLASCLVEY